MNWFLLNLISSVLIFIKNFKAAVIILLSTKHKSVSFVSINLLKLSQFSVQYRSLIVLSAYIDGRQIWNTEKLSNSPKVWQSQNINSYFSFASLSHRYVHGTMQNLYVAEGYEELEVAPRKSQTPGKLEVMTLAKIPN